MRRSAKTSVNGFSAIWLCGRAVRLTAVLTCAAFSLVPDLVVNWRRGRRRQFAVLAAERVRRVAPLVGPSFVKTLQLLSTRTDMVGPKVCEALSLLHDAVPPMRRVTARRILSHIMDSHEFAYISHEPIASGSIACVYRGRLRDGRDVAVKVRRKHVENQIRADVRLLGWGAALLSKVPALRQVPVREFVRSFSAALLAQVDFVREASNLMAIRQNLSGDEGVYVPEVYSDFTRESVLVLEYVDGLVNRPADTLDPAVRCTAARRILLSAYKMLFCAGIVHCDLHPGNLYVMDSGSLVILDGGFVQYLSRSVHKQFADFFFRMGTGNGQRAADILVAAAIRRRLSNYDQFRSELAALIRANSGLTTGQFNLAKFAAKLFDLQRRHGLYADASFIYPILSLLVLENTTRELDPHVDFQGLAIPFLMPVLFGSD